MELHEIHGGVEPRYDAHHPFPHFRRCDRLFEIWPRLQRQFHSKLHHQRSVITLDNIISLQNYTYIHIYIFDGLTNEEKEEGKKKKTFIVVV